MTQSWRLTTRDSIGDFLPAAATLLRGYNTLCIEHADTDKDALELYNRHVSKDTYWPKRDTISPHTNLFYCHLSLEFVEGLMRLTDTRATAEVPWHMRGYDGQRLILCVRWGRDLCIATNFGRTR